MLLINILKWYLSSNKYARNDISQLTSPNTNNQLDAFAFGNHLPPLPCDSGRKFLSFGH